MGLLLDTPYGEISDLAGACVAIGVFDGCHLGHQALIGSCVAEANEIGAKCVILTFDIDPDELFSADSAKIMSNDERISYLSSLNPDSILLIRFDRETSSIEPTDFLDTLFANYLPKSIYVGSDFRFGKAKKGTTETLSAWCEEHAIKLYIHKLIEKDGQAVKSTRIRKLLDAGELQVANALLGHPYEVSGKVGHGRGEGKSFGFATANVSAKTLLGDGVYAGYAQIDSCTYKAAISVGIPPTFEEESDDALEVHILDYNGDLYGKTLYVSFLTRLRPMIKFSNVDDLIKQVESDISYVRDNL